MKALIVAALAASSLTWGSLVVAQGTGDFAAYATVAASPGQGGGEYAVTLPASSDHYGTYLTLDRVIEALAADLSEKLDTLLASGETAAAPHEDGEALRVVGTN